MPRIFMPSALMFFISTLTLHAEPKLLDKIVAIVGNQIVTLSDLETFRKDVEKQNVLKASGQLDTKALTSQRGILQLLVRERLMEQAVQRLELKATDDEVEIMINRIQKQNQLNRAQLRDALKAQGMSLEVFRANIQRQIEKQNLIQKEIQPKVQITEQDVFNYYLNRVSHKGSAKASYRFSHILVLPKSHGGPKGALKHAQTISKEIKGGLAFGDAVKKYSEDPSSSTNDGDLGSFTSSDLSKAFLNALQPLGIGDVSEPVIVDGKVHILKLTDKKVDETADFKERKEEIRSILQREEFDRQLNLWFETQEREAHVKVML